jgi:hypothetical protein
MKININKLVPNSENPRIIKDYKFQKLVNSIREFPEMLEKRPIVVDESYVVLGGNMRLKACKEAGLKEVYINIAKGWTEEQKKEFIIKDNVGFGEWDWDALANTWDSELVSDWGLDFKFLGENSVEEEWKGMPEFEQDNLNPKTQIIVSFATEEDRESFSKLIGQKLTEKTKSIWHPQQEQDIVKDLNY